MNDERPLKQHPGEGEPGIFDRLAVPSAGRSFRWSGVILMILAIIVALGLDNIFGAITWLGLFLAGAIFLAAGGIIKAVGGRHP